MFAAEAKFSASFAGQVVSSAAIFSVIMQCSSSWWGGASHGNAKNGLRKIVIHLPSAGTSL